jgi:hypothetical protein
VDTPHAGPLVWSVCRRRLSSLCCATVYFSDRPERRASHIASDAYVASWLPGGTFAVDPLNAALAIPGSGSGPQETVIVTLDTVEALDAGGYRCGVTIVSGSLPEEAVNVALFVDPTGPGDPGNGEHL